MVISRLSIKEGPAISWDKLEASLKAFCNTSDLIIELRTNKGDSEEMNECTQYLASVFQNVQQTCPNFSFEMSSP